MKKRLLTSLIILLLLGAACTPAPDISRDDKLATVVARTLTAQPKPTFTPIPTFTPRSAPMVTATNIPTDPSPHVDPSDGPVYIRTRAQNVNLRTNPGLLFKVSRVMAQGTRLQVLGLAPGGEWVSVLNDEGIVGWVGIDFVDEFRVDIFPTVEPRAVQSITGRVLDANGQPVSGIGFAILGGTESKPLRTDATTDFNGWFYAYLPLSATGVWTVSYVSVACTSNTMDLDCNCIQGLCGAPVPISMPVGLSVSGPITFSWK